MNLAIYIPLVETNLLTLYYCVWSVVLHADLLNYWLIKIFVCSTTSRNLMPSNDTFLQW